MSKVYYWYSLYKNDYAIIIFMSVELMLNAVNLLLTAFSSYHGDASGQVFVFFIMALAAAEVAVGLAIIVMVNPVTALLSRSVLSGDNFQK